MRKGGGGVTGKSNEVDKHLSVSTWEKERAEGEIKRERERETDRAREGESKGEMLDACKNCTAST